jgi:hypothetical protein
MLTDGVHWKSLKMQLDNFYTIKDITAKTGKTYYRVSVKDFDGKYYVKSAGLTRHEAELEVELYRQQYLKAVAIPCGGID